MQHMKTDMRRLAGLAALGFVFVLAGCESCTNPPDGEKEIADEIFGELGGPMKLADEEHEDRFERGRSVALKRFSGAEGLGPSFNTTRCVSCHEQPAFGGSSPRYRDFFLVGKTTDSGFEMVTRPESIDHPENDEETYEAPEQANTKSGVQLRYRNDKPYRNRMPDEINTVGHRNAIPFFGIGALAQVPQSEIEKRADTNDEDDDGISGRVNVGALTEKGRFGLKAQTRSLEGFVRGPMFNHVGITTDPLTEDMRDRLPFGRVGEDSDGSVTRSDELRQRRQHQVALPDEPLEDSDDIEDPEMSTEKLFELISFVQLLAAPEPDELDETSRRGKQLFEEIQCAECHVPALDSPLGKIPAYTDLLIHDMGEELAAGIQQSDARPSEFRTQPLWGVAATEPYLHDGRANTLDEAIRMHGGEAARSSNQYADLEESEQRAIVEFLRSLGGADRDSEGRIPPDDPVPESGSFEAPVEGLSDSERATFSKGRRLFDRDMPMKDGLGPKFNGDSCRACHFEPTTAGAGPPGVNVTREGHLTSSGTFMSPPGGTLLHRFTTDFESRPSPHETSNVFELRQPPPLYGLGKLDDVPDANIEDRADPADMDGDGISGRVAKLEDGSVGKFGWKAGFPTLEDFVRDALTNEVGLTVPDRPGVFAGRGTDEDWVEDPEFAGSKYDALVFYVDRLAPPPDGEAEGDVDRGENVFADVGCADCHTPELETSNGEKIEAYTDLLLHEIVPEEYRGIAGGAAGPREFRTPPLWGISESGPYMHDGLAGTLDTAIRRHAGEAADVADAYENLSKERREALLAFLTSL